MSPLIRSVGLRRGGAFNPGPDPDPGVEYGMTSLNATPSTFEATQQAGWWFLANADRTVVGLRIYGASSGTEVLRLWNFETQALVASVTVTSLVGQWVEGLLDSPVQISSNTRYVVTARRQNAASRTLAYLPMTNITFHADVTAGQASFSNTDGYPGAIADQNVYGLPDVILEAAA